MQIIIVLRISILGIIIIPGHKIYPTTWMMGTPPLAPKRLVK
jgi:hypothetical protein